MPATSIDGFAARTRRWTDAASSREVLADAVPFLRETSGAAWVLALASGAPAPRVVARAGSAPTDDDVELIALPEATRRAEAPEGWTGTTALSVLPLVRGRIRLVLGWLGPANPDVVDDDLALLELALRHQATREDLTDLAERVDAAQQLADMGDYDWHIASDTNQWSDHLFRIYGYEPRAFAATYERFLDHVHPDDRDRVQRIHQRAYTTGEPYQMLERIVRPDGEVRHLSSNGQVIRDEAGTPTRMRGTCLDVTEQVRAKQAEERSAGRFRALVESAPDAIVLLDEAGTIIEANGRAGALLGGDPVGHSLARILPAGPDAPGLGVEATGLDGRRLELDVVTVALAEEDKLSAAFLHDSGPRLHGEQVAAQLREAQVRRRQALELNDSVIQGLVAAILAMHEGDELASARFLGHTLTASRRMMNEWLAPLHGQELDPSELLRSNASSFDDLAHPEPAEVLRTAVEPAAVEPVTGDPDLAEAQTPDRGGVGRVEEPPARGAPTRVLLVEDNEDVRELLRHRLESVGAYDVVGEAGDGAQAVELVAELEPTVVLLDLAMPRMDGLTALPLILEACPATRVIVLSGFDQAVMAERALAAGADAYVEKGLRMDLDGAIRAVLGDEPQARVG